jgi:small-conductance mechanosensitive channel
VLSLTLAGSSLVANLVRHYGPSLKGATPVTTLSQNLLRALVWSIGLLIILNQFGVSITPILTALGVGGLAIALALQETLSNLFAGFYVSVAGHVRVGDYIRLDSGDEGFVTDISWRATTIRALANNLIVVPNSKLAQAIVTNYTLPEPRVSFGVPVNVSLESDPDHVERVLLDEATSAVGQIPGLVGTPVVRFNPGVGESSLGFTVLCDAAQFTDQYSVQHELRKRIVQRLRAERIDIPYPTRTVHLHTPES